MSSNPVHTLNDKYLRLYGIPISVIALLLAQMPYYFPGRWDLFVKYVLIGIFFTASMWEVSRVVLVRVRHQFPSLDQTRQRVVWMFLLFTVQLGIGQALITQTVISMGLAATSTFSFFQIWLINFACSLFFIVVISSVYEAIYFFEQYRNALQKAEHLKKQQVQQRLEALKSRVNPHFLFNSLTTLSALIGEDAARAERFVDELSKVYRYLLRAGRQTAISLQEELSFVKAYAFLLKNRFEAGAFSLQIQSEQLLNASDHSLPALSLQNALDYLVRTQNIPLHIGLRAEAHQLEISCPHQPKSLSFSAPDADWHALETQAARQAVQDGELKIWIPFIANPNAK